MMIGILAGVLVLGLPQQQIDTTFAVRVGGSVEVDAFAGSLTVRTWDREEMRVRATHNSATRVRIRHSGGSVEIETEARRYGPAGSVQLDITVPRRFHVAAEGINLAVTVDGVQGNVQLENVEGTLSVRGVIGDVELESVMGGISVDNLRGTVEAINLNASIAVTNSHGDIEAETINGNIVMRGVDAEHVEATTVNGVIEYDGALRDGGRYYLGAHNGRITLAVPAQANATITASANSGRVNASFSVPVGAMRDGRFSYTVGSGGARVELDSFNGSIHLVRPGGR